MNFEVDPSALQATTGDATHCWYCEQTTAKMDGTGHLPECPYGVRVRDPRGDEHWMDDFISSLEVADFDWMLELMNAGKTLQ